MTIKKSNSKIFLSICQKCEEKLTIKPIPTAPDKDTVQCGNSDCRHTHSYEEYIKMLMAGKWEEDKKIESNTHCAIVRECK